MDERKFNIKGSILTNRKDGPNIFSCFYLPGVCTRYVVGNMIDGFIAAVHTEDDRTAVYQHRFDYGTYETHGPSPNGETYVPFLSDMAEEAAGAEQIAKAQEILANSDKAWEESGNTIPELVELTQADRQSEHRFHTYWTAPGSDYGHGCVHVGAWGPWFGQHFVPIPGINQLVVGNARVGFLYWNAKGRLSLLQGTTGVDSGGDLKELYSEPIKHVFGDFQITRDLLERL